MIKSTELGTRGVRVQFVLSVANIIEEVQASFPEVTVVGIADDYRFVGPVRYAPWAASCVTARQSTEGGELRCLWRLNMLGGAKAIRSTARINMATDKEHKAVCSLSSAATGSCCAPEARTLYKRDLGA